MNLMFESYQHGFEEALSFYKIAGGPGSGVSGKNTKPIEMPHSPHVSVGTRQGILKNMHYVEREIPLKDITHAGQSKYVPKKLTNLLGKPEVVREKPIQVLQVGEHDFHVIDGHHRYLAAKKLGFKTIKACVYKKAAKTMREEKKA